VPITWVGAVVEAVDVSAELAAAGSVAASAAVAGAAEVSVLAVLLLLQPAMPRVRNAAMPARARAFATRASRVAWINV